MRGAACTTQATLASIQAESDRGVCEAELVLHPGAVAAAAPGATAVPGATALEPLPLRCEPLSSAAGRCSRSFSTGVAASRVLMPVAMSAPSMTSAPRQTAAY